MVVYADADFSTPNSTSGWIAFLRGPNGSIYLLDWQSKKQPTTATSTSEAEPMALALAVKNAMRLATMVDETRSTGQRGRATRRDARSLNEAGAHEETRRGVLNSDNISAEERSDHSLT